MQRNSAAQAINSPIIERDRRYFEGLAKLNEVSTLHQSLNGQQLDIADASISKDPSVENPVPQKKTSLETALLEKGRSRSMEEYIDHQAKADAYLMLADRYKSLGMEDRADACNERGRLERATTRGFQSVIEAYDKKLTALGVQKIPAAEPKNLHEGRRSLESAERFLESYKSDYSTCCEHTNQVLKAEIAMKKLNDQLVVRPPTPVEKKQFEEALNQRDKSARMAEYEALNAATSFKHFQSEIQSVEKSCNALSKAMREKPAPEHEQISQDPALAGSDRRMNRLAMGMVVSQTLKVLDREL